ncbi:hypothetical protein V6C53_04995 [Desulfocurvibacter africanus]|uniref:hypothetical protein n=1 Tax=Desulfocurvibacter africanus TaxID=873 RepID=UPI002FD9B488
MSYIMHAPRPTSTDSRLGSFIKNIRDSDFIKKITADLFKPWFTVFISFFSPLSLIPASLAIALTCYSDAANEDLKLIINILIAIFSSIVGAVVYGKWLEIDQKTILHTRGESAIRNLRSLFEELGDFELRVSSGHKKLSCCQSAQDSLTNAIFEELRQLNTNIKRKVIDSIEDWNDIIPIAGDIRSKLKQISDAYDQLQSTQNKKFELERKLSELEVQRDSDATEKNHLKNELEGRITLIKALTEKMNMLQANIDESILAGINTSTAAPSGGLMSTSWRYPFDKEDLKTSGIDVRCGKCGEAHPLLASCPKDKNKY